MTSRLQLPDVTLVSISSVRIRRTIAALRISMESIDFGDVILVTHEQPSALDSRIRLSPVKPMRTIDAYNRFVVYQLGEIINTSHCLIVQADGHVLHPERWEDQFLRYDYIGAPWPQVENSYVDPFGVHQRVGNGGFSLRSSRLLTVPGRAHVEWNVNEGSFYRHMDVGLFSEDGCICVHNRAVYEAEGCLFAPVDVAARFSQELQVPETSGIEPFGFHKYDPRTGRKRRAPWLAGWSFSQ